MRIGIVGLGLIGGSLGLDFRSLGYPVVGVSRRSETCQRALERGAVDEASVDPQILHNADVVFLCTPLGVLEPTMRSLLPFLQPSAILTDVGSVKAPVVEALTPLWPNFVGGHPMAGTADQGIEAAQFQLFAGNPYVLTPTPTTPLAAIATLQTLIYQLQARFYECHPAEHDRAVAWISHLPVMVSSSLIAACLTEADPQVLQLAHHLASSGFRDTSRVGGGNPELGLMMAQFNRSALLQTLSQYRQVLDRVIETIHQEDWTGLEAHLETTQAARPDFMVPRIDTQNCPSVERLST